ncbi:MAG TPA: PepSY-associated TM helix domain-containing protein [Rhizomicrobium sp.]|jgi:uncharacterized iron-regulated membrane protein|nr:PepSY-associated TM helix domain-containing protein [Rhizomicrobium sp.]
MSNAANATALEDARARFARKARAYNALVWLHRYSGLVIMLFLILAGVTGSILVFRNELDAALNRDLFAAPVAAPMAAPAAIADAVAQAHPEWQLVNVPLILVPGQSLAMRVVATAPAAPLSFDQVFIDPHDGHLIGTRAVHTGWDRRHLVEGLYEFHYTLLAGTAGRWFMGVIAIVWFLSNLLGLYLTFPQRAPFWKGWGKMWLVRRGTRFARFCLDLHRASALWLFIGLFVIALTSVEMNLYDELFVPAVNAVWEAPKTPFDEGEGAPSKKVVAPKISFAAALQEAASRAAKDHPGWVPDFATYAPELNLFGVSFIRSETDTYSALGPAAYYVDGASGAVTFRDDPYNEGARGAVMRSLYPLHSGRIWGWPTRSLVFILGLVTVVLSLTGLYVWWRKR